MRLGNAMYSFMLLLTHLQYQAPADYEWGICLLILQNTCGGREGVKWIVANAKVQDVSGCSRV
jgi:hypothetical protein